MEIRNNTIFTAGFAGQSAVRAAAQDVSQKSEDAKTEQAPAEKPANQDTFTRTGDQKPVTYSKNQLTSAQVQSLQQAEQARQESFLKMIQSMVVKQGQTSNLTLFGMELFVTPEQSAAAAKEIAPGGEYSVDAVAGRIMEMAKALSGGDPSKIEMLREAVIKGFKAAGVELGVEELPSVSQDTYTEVMKRFDEWAKESKTATVEE